MVFIDIIVFELNGLRNIRRSSEINPLSSNDTAKVETIIEPCKFINII